VETDPGHASQLPGDGARDVAGSEIGGRAPAFTHTQYFPDEGLEGGERAGLPGMADLSGIYPGKTSLIYSNNPNTPNNMYSPTYASPLITLSPCLSWTAVRLTRPTRDRKLG
jgi:hypothetical protein